MFRNAMLLAVRHMIGNRIQTFVNVAGLSVGIASVVLIGLYLHDELSYDRFHSNADRLHRLTRARNFESVPSWVGTPAPLAPGLVAAMPELEKVVRIDPMAFNNKTLVDAGGRVFYEDGFVLADPTLFEVFDFPLVRGDPATVLEAPENLVLSASAAKRYFGERDPVGSRVLYDGRIQFIVTGVMQDIPANSHLQFEFVGSFARIDSVYGRDVSSQWGRANYLTYVLLRDGIDVDAFTEKASAWLRETLDDAGTTVTLQKVTDIHLHSNALRDPYAKGSSTRLLVYATIAVVILLVACINFTNMYTAASAARQKEVGMRKVLGAHRSHLVRQFLGEAVLFAAAALPVGFFLAIWALPAFNEIAGKALTVDDLLSVSVLVSVLMLVPATGIIAGAYPAVLLSSMRPISMLRSRSNSFSGADRLRSLLVIIQFAITVIFISASLIISDQIGFLRNARLGYDRANLISVPLHSRETRESFPVLRDALSRVAGIDAVTATSFTPSVERWREGLHFEGRQPDDAHMFFRISGDPNFAEMFGLELIAGRFFDPESQSDMLHSFIVNESAVRSMGWSPEEAIGKSFGSREGRLVGVVRDFHFRSLKHETQPLAINVLPRLYRYATIRYQTSDIQALLADIEATWESVNAQAPFEFFFFDSEFDRLYRTETRLGLLLSIFTVVAVFVACLGLFGLASFVANKRAREIGIRKVLGASVAGIVVLLAGQFARRIILANLIAWPIAYLLCNSWLQAFAYRIEFGFGELAIASLLALAVGLFTISGIAGKAAMANPAAVLRNE